MISNLLIVCKLFIFIVEHCYHETSHIILNNQNYKGSSRINCECVCVCGGGGGGGTFFLNPTTHQLEFILTPPPMFLKKDQTPLPINWKKIWTIPATQSFYF